MPELAEVEFYRKQWARAHGETIVRVHLHDHARVFRDVNPARIRAGLTGAVLVDSAAQAKQMLFQFARHQWLGVHLGMAGRLQSAAAEMVPGKHDHLVLFTRRRALVFNDYRLFGRILWEAGEVAPRWWSSLPPPVLSDDFTRSALRDFLQRRARSPIKAVLLMQERFPGIGNWMADEILWRARIRPDCPAGLLAGRKLSVLHRCIRSVAEDAMREIAGEGSAEVSHELSASLPDDWLFNHRWRNGGNCPRTGKPLVREQIGGRTTCWSPAWQRWPRESLRN